MITEINIVSQLLCLIALILFFSLLVLIKLVDRLKDVNFKKTDTIVIEKQTSKVNSDKKNNKSEDLEPSIVEDLDNKWLKSRKVESKLDGIGDKNVVDGSASMNAVNIMRNLKNKSNNE